MIIYACILQLKLQHPALDSWRRCVTDVKTQGRVCLCVCWHFLTDVCINEYYMAIMTIEDGCGTLSYGPISMTATAGTVPESSISSPFLFAPSFSGIFMIERSVSTIATQMKFAACITKTMLSSAQALFEVSLYFCRVTGANLMCLYVGI